MRAFVTFAVCVGSIGLAVVAFPLADYRTPNERILRDAMVPVLSRTTRRTTPAVVELRWSAGHQTSVGDATGKVTDVFISPGEPLKCGEPVVAIDGAARLAMCGAVPPWRDISASTKGPDAEELAELLVSLGLLSEEDRDDGVRRAAALRQLLPFVGLPASGSFHPSDVIWIPSSTTPSRVTVQVGSQVAGDSVLFDVDAILESATVHPTNGDQVAAEETVFSIDGSGVEFSVLANGSLDENSFEAAARSTMSDPDAELPSQIQGILRLVTPVSYAAVPASALVTTPDGSLCVVLANGLTTAVTIVESVTGLVIVDADLPEGTRIRDLPPAGTTC